MMKNAINEMLRYKRLPYLTEWAWKCVITAAICATALLVTG